jgi:hypothetical protein
MLMPARGDDRNAEVLFGKPDLRLVFMRAEAGYLRGNGARLSSKRREDETVPTAFTAFV